MSEISADKIYSSFGQRIARILHYLKVRFRNKEKDNVFFLSRFIDENSIIFDIGANLGHFSKEFVKLYGGNCFVYSFEPVKYNFSILEKVVSRYKNIKIENLALSNSVGFDYIFIPVKESGKIGNGLAHLGQENSRDYIKERIALNKLDDYVEKNAIQKIDFIKCDVEGAEMLVFKGGYAAIKNFRPRIFCEIDEKMTKRLGYSPKQLWKMFEEIDYGFYEYNKKQDKIVKTSLYNGPADYFIFPNEYKIKI